MDEATKMAIMSDWLGAVATEIDADPALITAHRDELLDLVGAIAHGPSRPGAPMTLFLLGLRAGAGEDVSELVTKVNALVESYIPQER
ncbi:DUF6457 domain-containing protein [Trueperella pecoris]|uniref:Molybdopterin-guanine dinucleotide biosynthesis protein n=1 Tax=Trueperella pecoris TaxID=2733571 RepID=A0A7M1QX02_9ACTO|nr:DUF6457 domain-containing protein [Trueperella pecoris]QOQ38985.1 molybdopterin-guanine dinucleotide biosynthesis protein [Trueperella pecoris]QOR46386.1 molybdopterin-guanine dinucleotide biosynthesis protein [Trueperella pecoris]QTG76211.1 molybdopterin-guanine dinucleotide biosynthesis protein [Trueperella pecoris]